MSLSDNKDRREKTNTWFLILGWSSPIGVGIFLFCLGGMAYLLSKVDSVRKCEYWKEKGK